MSAHFSQDPYGTECGFCSTPVAEHAVVCSGCGATKGTRAQILRPGAALMRAAIWANTFGLVIFAMFLAAAQPWRSDKILNGVDKVCRQELKTELVYSMTSRTKNETFRLGNSECEGMPNLEARKQELVNSARKSELQQSNSVKVNLKLGKTWTGDVAKRDGPTLGGVVEAVLRSATALFIGMLLLRFGAAVWPKFFGRLTDPMWVR